MFDLGQFLASFRETLDWLSLKKKSRVVVALDTIGGRSRFQEGEVVKLIDSVSDAIVGVKLGLPFYLNLGPSTRDVIKHFQDLVFIADWKTADVPHVTRLIFENIFDLGFNAGIIHAFTGTKSMSEAVNAARSRGGDVIAVVAMSHEGSELVNSQMHVLADMAVKAGVGCFVAPSNNTSLIQELRAKHPSSKIFSPGVGAQGGEVKAPLRMGADYLIVGRLITDAPNPDDAARRVASESWI
ncbi:orotidine-5'-phosphate decarboxylase [Candidatus Marsarchaeota G2 archaeon OSP_D]|jgi:orotidine 5''-phosphate decarboxylase, subfamily 1|uniref:Orotidine 5'-phosphate decarboxylase n=4 Tax=Candidatus Marsarchaeota group 2 TaxID=2203771 RepID=A0A2R6B692_9ARCH|nr:MAG: orotidine-5'-phosphate decarboxylase [Candidatus Marsarchaeota G2 archaeon OSP_D]PSN91095.1 MAG: orotidine-5'-phosphate decarboxylase [Candidatus Marsarchaeota G2 archaeon ECH_B_SAG-M15]PSN94092.1 MAG: orotidine-5'-phosphate decarboxylase [Candidatus Marsarchaeota G2 archaeon ECH_B_2]PSO00253.1 MAG: orotidine-5'-phosphate decarboxylase [Candidatus Marsarchaeota G2 archaeon ECH_B_1]